MDLVHIKGFEMDQEAGAGGQQAPYCSLLLLLHCKQQGWAGSEGREQHTLQQAQGCWVQGSDRLLSGHSLAAWCKTLNWSWGLECRAQRGAALSSCSSMAQSRVSTASQSWAPALSLAAALCVAPIDLGLGCRI